MVGYIFTVLLTELAEGVGVMKGATFFKKAFMLMGSQLNLPLADSKQVIVQDVTVMNLKPHHVILSGVEVSELFLPPGVWVVVAN